MLTRAASLLVALAVALLPIAPEVCDALCASAAPVHHMAAPEPHGDCGTAVSAQLACCADASHAPLAPVAAAKIAAAPQVTAASFTVALRPSSLCSPVSPSYTDAWRSISPGRRAQLRV